MRWQDPPSGGLAYNCGMPRLIAAIDAGTTSTRCILFDRAGRAVAAAQKEHRQITPRSGWLEHEPQELWTNTAAVIAEAMARADASAGDVAAVGLTNQRETTLLWERATGRPVHNAIVWSDARTAQLCEALKADSAPGAPGGIDRFRAATGLPIATYFSATKLAWMLESVPGVRQRAAAGDSQARWVRGVADAAGHQRGGAEGLCRDVQGAG